MGASGYSQANSLAIRAENHLCDVAILPHLAYDYTNEHDMQNLFVLRTSDMLSSTVTAAKRDTIILNSVK